MNEPQTDNKPGVVKRLFRTFRQPKVSRAPGPLSDAELSAWITQRVAQALEVTPESVDPDRPLSDFGLDSRAAVTLAGDLEKLLGRTVEVTLAWDHPTINAIVAHLRSSTAPADPS